MSTTRPYPDPKIGPGGINLETHYPTGGKRHKLRGLRLSLDGIPETITRKAALSLIKSLGLNVENLLALSFHPNAIEAEVYSLDAEGRRFLKDGDTVATHTICIKVVDDAVADLAAADVLGQSGGVS